MNTDLECIPLMVDNCICYKYVKYFDKVGQMFFGSRLTVIVMSTSCCNINCIHIKNDFPNYISVQSTLQSNMLLQYPHA